MTVQGFSWTALASLSLLAALAGACAPHHKTVGDNNAEALGDETAKTTAKTTAIDDAQRTVKPGAAVSLSHAFRSPPQTGEFSVVSLTLKEDYEAGLMRATATGSEGLEVFGAPATFVYPMEGDAPGVWDVTVKPLRDGVHYLNVTVQVEKDETPGPARAFAVKIIAGAQAGEKADGAVEAIEMKADETIEQR